MKKLIVSIALGLICAGLPLRAEPVKETAARPVRLQIAVYVPASANTIRDDDIADAFAYRIAAALHEQGFKGHIKYLDNNEEPAADKPTLEINLMEWRVNRTGNVDCSFGAVVKGPSGEKGLGLFTGSSLMVWARHAGLGRGDGFDQAAKSAMGDLAKKVSESGLVPEPAANNG